MAICVECDAEFDIDEVEVGDVVACPECGLDGGVVTQASQLEAVTDDEEDEAPEEEEESSEWE